MTGAVASQAPPEENVVSIDDFDGTLPLSSPRSLEACYELGITPDELLPRTLASFARPKEEASFTLKRAEQFEQRRQQLLVHVQVTRQRLVQSPRSHHPVTARLASSPTNKSKSISPVSRSQHHKSTSAAFVIEDSTVIENERKRLEKIQQRQMAEMQQMVNWEIKQAEMEAKQAEQVAMRKRQEETLEREKVRRMREAEEARRQRELEKVQRELDEVAAARALAARDYAEAKKRKEMEERAKVAWKQEMIQRERDRAKKADEYKQMTTSILNELEAQAAKRMDDMARRDQARKEKLERRRQEQRAEMLEKTIKNKERMASVMGDKERLAQQQRDAYAQRQAESETRRMRLEAEMAVKREEQARLDAERREVEEAIREHQKILEAERRDRLVEAEREAEYRLEVRNQEKEARRQQKILDEAEKNQERIRVAQRMRDTEEQRQSQILTTSQAKGQRAQMMQMRRQGEVRAKWEDAKLRAEAIHDALMRKSRRDDYHKSVLMSKLESDQARAEAIKKQKEAILQQRKLVKQQADIQRADILNSFYKMKVTKKFNLQAVESVLGSTSNRPKSATTSPTKPKIATRPKTAPKTARRPKTPVKKKPPVASAVCRQRYISRHISRYPATAAAPPPTIEFTKEAPSTKASPVTLTVEEQLEMFRRRQNQELLRVLEEEQAAEEQREVILRGARDGGERKRLEKIFGMERSHASERIMRLTEEHEIMFTQRMVELKGPPAGTPCT
ncbi:Aste57867_19961 [Aphanomyces stellatus]|uniref:Aste57867_19961 protein n=1 Tax=Aphanomyces stellatus TaxID=120398 RepID=A0A485LDR4_9STRA|nr:hypothetical protein As57867_019895 [Aphanomyces stellatus]VFT96658.1 Aste57867_19961 [Aphanomyces stellatus]